MISLKFNKSDYKLIAIFFVIMAIWLVLKFYTEGHPLEQILFDTPIILAKTLAALLMIGWLAQKCLAEKKQYTLFILLSIVALVITGFGDQSRNYFEAGRTWSDLPPLGVVIMQSFYSSSADLAMPFLVIMIKKYFENQTSLAIIREQQKDNELKLLRSQLSPHFLFNNLNTVDALIDSDPAKAKAYIARLSSLYRYLITTREDDIVTLTEELTMVKDYFYLIKTRFGDAYTFEIDEGYAFAKAYIPSGALQTVIENVVKHNKVMLGKPVRTTLKITKDAVILINTKSATATQTVESLGTGLKNLKERYELLVDKTIIITETTTHFEVNLPLVHLTSRS